MAKVAVFVGDDGHGFVQSEDGVHQLDDRVRQDVALHVLQNVGKHGSRHGHLNVIRGFDTDRHRVRQQDLAAVGEHGKHVVDAGQEASLVEGTWLNHRSGEVALTGEEARSVEGPNALEDASALEGLTLHVSNDDGRREGLHTAAGRHGSLKQVLACVFGTGHGAHRGVLRRHGVVVKTVGDVGEVVFADPALDDASTGPRAVGGVDAIAVQLTGVGARELARHRNAIGLEGPVLGERHLTRSLKDAGFFGGEGSVVRHHSVVVGVGPNVAQDEGRVHKRFTGEGFVASPRHDAAHTARGHGKVRRAVERLHTVGFVSADVEVSFTHPGHVGDLAEDGGDLVDGAVLVVFGQDVTEVLGEGAVLNRVAGRRGVVLADEGAHANVACWSKEGIASFFVGVHEADGDPIGVRVEVFAGFAGESVALDEEPYVLEGLSVVGEGHLTGHFSTGVELQDLDHGVGLSVAVLGVLVIVVVREDEVVHHRARKRQGLGHEGPRRAALAEVLRRLRVGAVAVHAKRGCTVADVGPGHHGVKELGRVVGTNVNDLHRIDFRTGLLIEHVLPDGFVDLFTRHFVGEGTALGLVHLRHEGGRVLTGQDGRSGEDAHGLSRVVLGVGRVTAGAWVEAVVDREVADFVVTLNRLPRSTVVVLHRIGALQTDDVGVEVHDLCFTQSIDQELDGHGQTGVGTVNVR